MPKPQQPPDEIEVKDEPGMAERFQRGLRRALNTPPTHRLTRKRKGPLARGSNQGPGKGATS